MKSLIRNTTLFLCLLGFVGVGFAQSSADQDNSTQSNTQGAKKDMKNAGHATKNAAKSTGSATKKTTKKAVHGTKKGINKGAEKTAQGAKKVQKKTAPSSDDSMQK